MPIPIILELKIIQRELLADQEHLHAIHFGLLKTRALIEQATVAVLESRALLNANKYGGSLAEASKRFQFCSVVRAPEAERSREERRRVGLG